MVQGVEIELTDAAALAQPSSKDDKVVRHKIVLAAFAVLQEVGASRFKVADVAKKAGVSNTLLYYYFDGKHALIAAAYAQSYADILERDLELTRMVFEISDTATEMYANVIARHAAALHDRETRRRRLDALSAAQHDPVVARAIAPKQREFTEELRDLVLGIRDRGWLPEDLNVEAFIMMMMSLPFGLVFQDLDPDFEADPIAVLSMVLGQPAAKGS